MSSESPKIICWDLAGTLINRVAGLHEDPVKLGVRSLLEDLSNRNYLHVITTGAGPKDGLIDLQIHKLDHYFDKVFGLNFFEVVNHYGIQNGEAQHRVIGIDDQESRARGLDLVFIYHPNGAKKDASFLEEVLDEIEKRDSESFINAFKNLYFEAELAVLNGQEKRGLYLPSGQFLGVKKEVHQVIYGTNIPIDVSYQLEV